MMIKSPNLQSKKQQLGLSLIELMVAITIGLLLMLGVSQIFIGSKQSYRLNEGNSRIQENGRFASRFLTNDIRMAGFWGCSKNITPNSTLNAGASTPDFTGGGITGTEGGGTNPDIIVLRGAYSMGVTVVPPYMNTSSAALHLNPGNGLNKFDILIVSDCSAADIFENTGPTDPDTSGTVNHNTGAVAVGPGNFTQSLQKTYAGDATIYAAKEYTYFIQANPNGEPALYRTEIGSATAGVAQEMVDGIENLQVLYGEDTDNDRVANRYVNAANVTDMGNVVSVRIALLTRSEDGIKEDVDTTTTYDLAGTVVGPFNDQRLRRVFTKTVTIRNRIN